MGWGIALGGAAEGYRAAIKASDEHDREAYEQQLRKDELAARKEISGLQSPVGQVVGSRGQSYTPAEIAAQYQLDPDTAAGLQTADDWNKYLQSLPPAPKVVANSGPSGATSGDMSGGAPLPAGAIPAGSEPVGDKVPATAAAPVPVESAPLPAQQAPKPVMQNPAPVPPASVAPAAPLLKTVGPARSHIAATIQAQAVNQGLRPNAVAAAVITPLFESSYDPTKTNGSSYGLYGFQKPTFTGLGGSDQTIMNPDTQIAAGIKNMKGGDWYLSHALGRDPTPTEIYLYHQQGPSGSKALLTADPNKPAVQALLDAGVYHNHTAAAQAINANLPAGAPQNPTVGQFVGGWDARTQQVLKDLPRPAGHVDALDAPAGGNTPIPMDAGTPAAGHAAAQPSPQAFGLPVTDNQAPAQAAAQAPDGLMAYTVKDANGNDTIRFTSQPRYGTADDHDMAVVRILQKHGMYDKAEALQNQILQRGLLRHQVEAGGLELDTQKRFQAAAMAAQSGDYGAFQAAYNDSPLAQAGGTHIQVGRGPNGQVAIGVYSNDTKRLLGLHTYASPQEMALEVAQLQDPKLLTQFMLENRRLNISQQAADTQQFAAETGRGQLGVQQAAEASMEPVRKAQAGMYGAEAETTNAARPGVVAESDMKQTAAQAQKGAFEAIPGSQDQLQKTSRIRAMNGVVPTPPQPIMVSPGQVAWDPTLGQVTAVRTKAGQQILPVDVANSAFAHSKEFMNGDVQVGRDAVTGQLHYLVNGAPFNTPQDALNYLNAVKASQKKK